MKVLTIRQPWAGAIFERDKDVENRNWATRYRGALIVHTSKRVDTSACVKRTPSTVAWEAGAIIGVVELVDCVRTYKSRWSDAGCYHWVLKNPRLLPAAIYTPGRLGLWALDNETSRRIIRLSCVSSDR